MGGRCSIARPRRDQERRTLTPRVSPTARSAAVAGAGAGAGACARALDCLLDLSPPPQCAPRLALRCGRLHPPPDRCALLPTDPSPSPGSEKERTPAGAHAMDLSEKERVEKAALRKRRQQGVAAGTSRFAELEQAVQEIRMNTLQVLKTPYYRNCKAARNIRRGMRVIRELCKQMRSETVTIGKERKEKGDGSATKRRKLVGATDPSGHSGRPSGSAGIDSVVGGSPAGVNFVLLSQNNNTPPVITELSDSP